MYNKYCSIDNSYSIKLNRWDDETLKETNFILQEKLDGSNVSLTFTPFGGIGVGSRNNYLGAYEECTFMGIGSVLQEPEYQPLLEAFRDLAVRECIVYQLFGEFFGKGVIDRINYGKKKVRFFDLFKDDEYLSQEAFYNVMLSLSVNNLAVNALAYYNDINAALDHSPDFFSAYTDSDKPQKAEGFVIKPWEKVIRNTAGSRFIFKKKSDAFQESMGRKNKVRKEIPAEVVSLRERFAEYFNENRMYSVFSKEGPIENNSDIGKYIKLINDDAIADFKADIECWLDDGMGIEQVIDGETAKAVFSTAGKLSSSLLLAYLKSAP